jgi:Flagellar hook-length control protein FliK
MSSSISGDLVGRVLLESMGRAAEAALWPGQRVPARVIEMLLTGDVLLDLGASRVVLPANRPMQPGERIVLEVVTGGANPELRIATDKTPADSKDAANAKAAPPQTATAQPPGVASPSAALNPRDLPVIMRALAEMPPDSVPIARAAQTFLQAAAAADLPAAVVEQIQRVLAPLHAALPAAELAPALRAFLAQSGLFTENQLAAALQEPAGPLTADQRQAIDQRQAVDQRQAIADVRLLLGALTPPGTPVPEPVRVFGEALLQQQLVVAEQMAATGGGQIAIPFMFGEEPVDIRFTWDREARQETRDRSEPDDDRDRALSLGVFVTLNIFGAIEARIIWKPESFAVTFYVEREATRAIVEAGLNDLSKELSASGFSAVAANVWLNPDRVAAGVAAGAVPVRPAIPAGTILDVMA